MYQILVRFIGENGYKVDNTIQRPIGNRTISRSWVGTITEAGNSINSIYFVWNCISHCNLCFFFTWIGAKIRERAHKIRIGKEKCCIETWSFDWNLEKRTSTIARSLECSNNGTTCTTRDQSQYLYAYLTAIFWKTYDIESVMKKNNFVFSPPTSIGRLRRRFETYWNDKKTYLHWPKRRKYNYGSWMAASKRFIAS